MEITEFLWATEQINALLRFKERYQQALIKSPKDVNITLEIKKIDNDLSILRPTLEKFHKDMIAKHEELSGKRFKVIRPKEKVKVVGNELKAV